MTAEYYNLLDGVFPTFYILPCIKIKWLRDYPSDVKVHRYIRVLFHWLHIGICLSWDIKEGDKDG